MIYDNQQYVGNIMGIPFTYLGTLTWELRNLREQETV